ncbi:hypothetical protein EYF80_002054 [Liparis tanakae]|uniref:Uncharacterized protein n=1 Tax=Liparis tanakae TaxID=230148 RepID=A0A4Z2JCI6_9TELE|nr:hypothetical protein EYF80_002054 [Liparis tanakae]
MYLQSDSFEPATTGTVQAFTGRKGPVPAVLKALTVKKYCVSAAKPLTVTDVWFQGTLTFPMASWAVLSVTSSTVTESGGPGGPGSSTGSDAEDDDDDDDDATVKQAQVLVEWVVSFMACIH